MFSYAHPGGQQHRDRKPIKTSVTEFCYESVNLSLEGLKHTKITLFSNTKPAQKTKFPEISHFF